MTHPGPSSPGTRQEMFDKFQPWVLATYGDSAKTKTITTKKAKRIVKLLQAKDKVPYVLVSKFKMLVEMLVINTVKSYSGRDKL